jgi:hypothetical protein
MMKSKTEEAQLMLPKEKDPAGLAFDWDNVTNTKYRA